jgi:hypothetical protein
MERTPGFSTQLGEAEDLLSSFLMLLGRGESARLRQHLQVAHLGPQLLHLAPFDAVDQDPGFQDALPSCRGVR